MKPPAPTDFQRPFPVNKPPEHTATAELKQPMFQLGKGSSASIDCGCNTMISALGTTSRRLRNSKSDSEPARASKFSYSSEILENNGRATEDGGNDWLKDRAAFRLRT